MPFFFLHDCVSEVVLCNLAHCDIQKSSDDTAIFGCISDSNDQDYRGVISDLIGWFETNCLEIYVSKGDGRGLQEEVTPFHPGEHPGKRH